MLRALISSLKFGETDNAPESPISFAQPTHTQKWNKNDKKRKLEFLRMKNMGEESIFTLRFIEHHTMHGCECVHANQKLLLRMVWLQLCCVDAIRLPFVVIIRNCCCYTNVQNPYVFQLLEIYECSRDTDINNL